MSTHTIQEGSRIVINIGGDIKNFTLAPYIHEDSGKDIISIHSPLGKCLHGKQEGDTAQCYLPDGTILEIEILSIS